MSETSKTLDGKVIGVYYGSDLFKVLKCQPSDRNFVNNCTLGNIDHVRQAIVNKTVTNINCPHVTGSTGLHEACENGHIEIVEFLLAQPCINVNSMDNYKMYPLHKACENNHPEIARLLLSKGAEWRKVTDVKTPYELIPNIRTLKRPTLASPLTWTLHKPKEFDEIFDIDGNSLVKVDDGLNFNDTSCLTFNNSQEGIADPVVLSLPPSGGERMRSKRKTHKKRKLRKTQKNKIQRRRIKSKTRRRQ